MTGFISTGAKCAIAAAIMVALSGCADTRRALGIDKSLPDEFAVISRAPLVMPPDFSLRPPAPGTERPQEGTTADQARRALLSGRAEAYRARGFSPGEVFLLETATQGRITANIRQVVDRETSAFAAEDASFTNRLLFWEDNTGIGTAIDPVAERRRLDRNQALGEDPNEGPIPVITRGGSSILGIF